MTLGSCMVREAGCALVKGWSCFSHQRLQSDSLSSLHLAWLRANLTQELHFSWGSQYLFENHLLLSEVHSLNSILTNAGVTPATGWAANISLGLKHKSLSPSSSNLSTLFTASGPVLKAFYKHMTVTIYSNLLILAQQFRLLSLANVSGSI